MKVSIILPDGTLAKISFSKLVFPIEKTIETQQGIFDKDQFETLQYSRGKTIIEPTEHSLYDYTLEEKSVQALSSAYGYRKIVLRSNSYFNYKDCVYCASTDKHVIADGSFMAAMNTVPFGYTIAISIANNDLDSICEDTILYTIYDKDGNALPPQNHSETTRHQKTTIGEVDPMFLSIRTFVY